MHASSFENMQSCHDRYASQADYANQSEVVLIDVGGADVNGGYRSIFSDAKYRYLTLDLKTGDGVDIVLDDPYKFPIPDNSADIVVSGQMLEHCEFFWLSFAEMVRILKPGGHIFLIAPSAGAIHRYPVDCYRFYPDAYVALAKYCNCHLHEVWLDERGPWRDLTGVFAKHEKPQTLPVSTIRAKPQAFDFSLAAAESEAERTISGERPYLDVLADLHAALKPRLYMEIGIRHGRSLSLADHAVGVDPMPEIQEKLSPNTRIFEMTSDTFFVSHASEVLVPKPDLIFIDGMHLFEYALRDFMNVERHSAPGSLVIVDDIFPSHPAQAARQRRTRVWMGDVWKLYVLLLERRPDLLLLPLDTSPSGLLLIGGLNSKSRILWDHYNPIVRKYTEIGEEPPEHILTRAQSIAPTQAGLELALKDRANWSHGAVAERILSAFAGR